VGDEKHMRKNLTKVLSLVLIVASLATVGITTFFSDEPGPIGEGMPIYVNV
jgi:flagellar basal body-associated protein FliL